MPRTWLVGISRKSPSEKPPVYAFEGVIRGARGVHDGRGEPGCVWQFHFLRRRSLQEGPVQTNVGRVVRRWGAHRGAMT